LHKGIRNISIAEDDKRWIVGCYSGDIYECDVDGISVDLKKKLMSSHFTPNNKWTNELWGLAAIYNTDNFVTCSDDGTLRLWSNSMRK
jgi:WD40 repeat protein